MACEARLPACHAAMSTSRWSLRAAAPRLPGLVAGLLLFGAGIALMAVAGLGLGPWEVFHEGIARITGLPLGTVSSLLGVPILIAWLPLGERPGIGTVLNIALIGLATNAPLAGLPPITALPFQVAAMLGGVVTIVVGCGLYLRFGWSIRSG